MRHEGSFENPPRSHTNGHEEKEKTFVFLRVTSWRIFIVSGRRSRHERLIRFAGQTRRRLTRIFVSIIDFSDGGIAEFAHQAARPVDEFLPATES
jgi:hypothetical protein